MSLRESLVNESVPRGTGVNKSLKGDEQLIVNGLGYAAANKYMHGQILQRLFIMDD
ncbi:MAG: hypothetical protein Q9191_008520, partial [Dirinaria sp. TL-2023a]